ncbi:MAG TPA: hypothetical protein VFP60_03540 [Pseudolabrys sp.]|nr:hypothetical protein [Pseudolabrys sp.]
MNPRHVAIPHECAGLREGFPHNVAIDVGKCNRQLVKIYRQHWWDVSGWRKIQCRLKLIDEGNAIVTELFADANETLTVHDGNSESIAWDKVVFVDRHSGPQHLETWAKKAILVNISQYNLLARALHFSADPIELRTKLAQSNTVAGRHSVTRNAATQFSETPFVIATTLTKNAPTVQVNQWPGDPMNGWRDGKDVRQPHEIR